MLWGVIAALASSCFAAGAFLSIKSIGNDEKAITTSMVFHTVSFTVALLPMLIGVPFPAVMPTAHEALLLSQVVWTSFVGQLMLSRGFQLLTPSVAAAINLSQVVHARTLSVLFLHDSLPWTVRCLLNCSSCLVPCTPAEPCQPSPLALAMQPLLRHQRSYMRFSLLAYVWLCACRVCWAASSSAAACSPHSSGNRQRRMWLAKQE